MVYLPGEPEETGYGDTRFRRMQDVILAGGFSTWHLGFTGERASRTDAVDAVVRSMVYNVGPLRPLWDGSAMWLHCRWFIMPRRNKKQQKQDAEVDKTAAAREAAGGAEAAGSPSPGLPQTRARDSVTN